MQRGRLRVFDINQNWATINIPFLDSSADVDLIAMFPELLIIADVAIAEKVWETYILTYNYSPTTGATPTVSDVAVLMFKSVTGKGLKVPLYGPADIFQSDGITIDDTNTEVASLIAKILLKCCDIEGNALSSYQTGQRVAG